MRVLLVDDHILFRDGLKYLLAGLDDDLSFDEANTLEEALPKVETVDIILLDLKLPDSAGVNAVEAVCGAVSGTTVVVLSSSEDLAIIRGVIAAGAAGFVPKSSTQDVLIAALRLILAGGSYLPPNLLHASKQTGSDLPPPAGNSIMRLSERQRQVVRGAVKGHANKVIARDLNISEATVKAHLSAAFRSLGVRNRTEAVYAVANHPEITD